ncbi:MAG: glycoside hydrolase family 3 protein [Clostridia bacterium]|nr:glycoside hydrolase family 3 protein [Clostridia bacterium]
MNPYKIDWEKYAALARQTVAEGCVLLKNDNKALPLRKGERVSVFGRIQFDYYKSGTGSGGAVNTRYVTGILDALKDCPDVIVNEKLETVYRDWVKEHPFEKGQGWAQEPWCQEEMPVSAELAAEAAAESDAAIVIIGRTAGEDKDNGPTEGSYLLTALEEQMLTAVTGAFKRVIVLLNVGNIIDMKWVAKYDPAAVMYVWQGGQEGGAGVLDVLTGAVSPSGKLSDTIAIDIADYPSSEGFGDPEKAIYKEDIYVGYRYFETFAKDRVLYPFGFGLSYTTFETEVVSFEADDKAFKEILVVKNTGEYAGKHVVQVYAEAPQGKLGKAARSLCAFKKTLVLEPGESEELEIVVPFENLASYDDSGVTGHKSAYVLEAGTYNIYTGCCVRCATLSGSFEIAEDVVTKQLREACAPVTAFDRMKPVLENGAYTIGWEPAPQRTYVMAERSAAELEPALPYTGDKGYKLGDVFDGKVSLDEFVAQIADEDLICLTRGEGMNSPKVTPGTGGAMGGVTDKLLDFGIPTACCSDGPSGIRMDCGTVAFSLPNGTLLACTFNEDINEELFAMQGLELRKNRVDTLLGPGLNIHRNPMNGRNFEYFSEDPLLTGKMAAAQLKGMQRWGTTGTVKHFACNNQEYKRTEIDSILSERALREIYLPAFEMAVKEGGAYFVMSTYGALNGIWTASNYDLLTSLLRKEWGFDGAVMTDWWAKGNDEGEEGMRSNVAAMIRAQNDLYMVVADAASNSAGDNMPEALADGRLSRDALVRAAKNICKAIMKSPVMERSLGRMSDEEREAAEDTTSEDYVDFDVAYQVIDEGDPLDISKLNTEKGASTLFGLTYKKFGKYKMVVRVKSNAGEVAQIPMSIFIDGGLRGMIMINGTNGEVIEVEQEIGVLWGGSNYLKLYFGQTGMDIEEIRLVCTQQFNL